METVHVVSEILPSGEKCLHKGFYSRVKAKNYIDEFCIEDRCNFEIEEIIFVK